MATNYALIIGANSQDGKYLSKLLLNKKYKVYALYNNDKKKLDKRLISVNINLNNLKNIYKFLTKFKKLKIFFFPSINISSTQNENYNLFIKNLDLNFFKLNNLLLAISKLKENKNFKVFYSSSSHIYKSSSSVIQSEKSEFKTNSFYGFAKLQGLRLCEFYRDKFDLFISVGILFPHFSKYSKPHFLFSKILRQVKSKKKTIYLNNAHDEIDFLHAKTVVEIIYKITNHKYPETFIISSGKSYKIIKIISMLGKILNKTDIKIKSKFKKSNGKKLIGKISKLKKKINFNLQELTLKKNLLKMINE